MTECQPLTSKCPCEDLDPNHLVQTGGDALIDDCHGNTIVLIGIDIDHLAANDFIF